MDPIIILGTGLAGYTVAREFRKYDSSTPLLFVTQDDGCAYSKPMLSNALSMKKSATALVNFDALAMEKQLNATILTQRSVESIDLLRSEIVVSVCSERLRYSQLVMALGAEPRRMVLAGSGAADILSVNDLRDYARFRAALEGCRSVAILGAGLIGCEFANDLAVAGYAVAVIDPAGSPLSRLVPQEMGAAFADGLRRHGVRFHLGRTPVAVELRTEGYQIMLEDGGLIEADLVVSAIGLMPRMGLAKAAGMETGFGIRTDNMCRTSAPGVYALGDCAEIDGRVQPYVLPIMHAARALARTLSGTPTPVAFPVMPVSVKTPALPAVVVAPPDSRGVWTVEPPLLQSLRAVCRDRDSGRTTGFSLMGSEAIKGKGALLQEMG
ncbi:MULTISPECIES: NAD(P)/FAD-dependent oxidoreductase [unclassified Duganella]|uniref:NAD(P)/FAD-dependent oxidoreductase n=1 Tax=unclassified Duganella TaxID=2636909 RepID=UPI000E354DF5|nr:MULTISPECIES: FAD-dependent oxidoreductase [unclassified Duganella]RFP08148.1 FAD-dependent oxidoreductase [Duganella sp. BJB475]RFP36171.1 FAD-dependent oxidoreductase [Duganella sp. BJB476]